MSNRIVAMLGDYYHKQEWAVQALNKALENISEIDVEYKQTDNLIKMLESKPKLVILFKENRLNPEDENVKLWMNKEVALAISQYVKEGGVWIAWHSGLASYDDIEKYTSMLKGHFVHHPEKHQRVTYTTEIGTEIIDCHEKFAFVDEHYFVDCDEEKTNIFLRSESVDGSSIAGWTHEYGKGRVICLTPAHLQEGLLHPMMITLLSNSLKLGFNMEK
ncbi:ThuA domain-containing protein [Lederbergia lenta]|uniref:ThuA domain-containing protein n=1 Tax=Lederbergia lenta TaxID=1467 RepID=UPI00203BFBBB|nr:ThuA domain-containing protein [Lederbergia lenta]MCM3110987.1 ThuA domain-containing protein [Lederbergia lenta]